jgi:hypothetical protein
MACLSEPAPKSAVVVTVNTAAVAGVLNKPRHSNRLQSTASHENLFRLLWPGPNCSVFDSFIGFPSLICEKHQKFAKDFTRRSRFFYHLENCLQATFTLAWGKTLAQQ